MSGLFGSWRLAVGSFFYSRRGPSQACSHARHAYHDRRWLEYSKQTAPPVLHVGQCISGHTRFVPHCCNVVPSRVAAAAAGISRERRPRRAEARLSENGFNSTAWQPALSAAGALSGDFNTARIPTGAICRAAAQMASASIPAASQSTATTRGRHRSIKRSASAVVRAAWRANGVVGNRSTSSAATATMSAGRASVVDDGCARRFAENDGSGSA